MTIVWSHLAIAHVEEIREYIARDNPTAAKAVATRIRRAVRRLRDHPRSGRPGRDPGTRELVVSGYPFIVAYKIHDHRVEILAVLHAACKWKLP